MESLPPMSQNAKSSGSRKPLRRSASRGLTVYDKIAAARERREGALAEKQVRKQPKRSAVEDERHSATTGAILDDVSPAVAALTDPPAPEDPGTEEVPEFDDAQDHPAPRRAAFWAVSTLIAAVVFGVIAWGSRPAGTNLRDIIPVAATLPTGPVLQSDAPGQPLVATSAPPPLVPATPSTPSRVAFGAMPGVQVADVLPGETPPPDLLTPSIVQVRNLRVVLNAPRTVTNGRLTDVVEALNSGGVIPDARRVNLTIRRANVRYFHPEDSEAAEVIASAIGADVRDFTDFEPKPDDALIEVWLSGQEIGNSGRSDGPLDQLSEDLRRLQRGLRQALSGN